MFTNGPTSNVSNYYLELRAPIGIDAALTPRVFVTVGGNIAEARGRGGRNWLLDMAPETATKADAFLAVGKMYSDPDPMGPSSWSSRPTPPRRWSRSSRPARGPAARRPGTGTCDDGSMFTAPGPETCSAAPISTPAPDGGAPPDQAGRHALARHRRRSTGGAGGSGGGTGGSRRDRHRRRTGEARRGHPRHDGATPLLPRRSPTPTSPSARAAA
jgi:hypothetical protein